MTYERSTKTEMLMSAGKMHTDPTGSVCIEGDEVSLSTAWSLPATTPPLPAAEHWQHEGRQEQPRNLAGRPGREIVDRYVTRGASLVRKVWIAAAGDSVALQQQIANRSQGPMRLDTLTPLHCPGQESLLIRGAEADGWEIVGQKRLKNEVPTSLRPGVLDNDWRFASRGLAETGETADGEPYVGNELEFDPFFVVRARGDAPSRCLLIGYLSQLGHCARLRLALRSEGDRTLLERLTAECEFDHTLLPPGGERASQWCMLASGDEPNALIADFADRVGVYHGVPAPSPSAPSVHCSWQFYGWLFDEANLIEDLNYLAGDRIPFDVFLIDECWDMSWGDWQANDTWPSGMKAAADRIRALGYRPGIWTCPFLARDSSQLARQHPEWLLRKSSGERVEFYMQHVNYVLDPTYPGVCEYIEETMRRLTEDWGYTYHKCDFLRAVFLDPEARFYDPTATRLQAYRRGLEAVRRGIGPGSYLSVCGGHYGGSLGLANSQRSGSDVVAMWGQSVFKFKQNVLRTWMSRLWHVDADAMMVRRREVPFNVSGQMSPGHQRLSLGMFTDQEAQTIALNQYLAGNLVCMCEKYLQLDADRKALYRHVVPSVQSASTPLNPFAPFCPPTFLTRIRPRCAALGEWVTLATVNWTDEPQPVSVALDETVLSGLPGDRFLVTSFWEQRALGLYERGAEIALGELAPHASRLLRVAPWPGDRPVLAGTDLHFSGGGVEIAAWEARPDQAQGRVETRWQVPVTLMVAFPSGDGTLLRRVSLPPGSSAFVIDRADDENT